MTTKAPSQNHPVIKALSGEGVTWRTLGGISRESGERRSECALFIFNNWSLFHVDGKTVTDEPLIALKSQVDHQIQ